MINFINDFRSTLPYKIGSIISGIISLLTILVYNSIFSTYMKGEGALLVLPALIIAVILLIINTGLFALTNILAYLAVPLIQDNKHKFNIFSDIGYFISICSIFYSLSKFI